MDNVGCAYCNRPIAPYGPMMYGRPGQGQRHADYFEIIHNKLLLVGVKFGDITARMEDVKVDWRCIVTF